jgi:hypothetical protein
MKMLLVQLLFVLGCAVETGETETEDDETVINPPAPVETFEVSDFVEVFAYERAWAEAECPEGSTATGVGRCIASDPNMVITAGPEDNAYGCSGYSDHYAYLKAFAECAR